MILHEAKNDQAHSCEEFPPLALMPLDNYESFSEAAGMVAGNEDACSAYTMPFFMFSDSDEDDEDDMDEDNFDDMEEEDFDDDEDDFEEDEEEEEEDFDEEEDDDYDYDDDEEFEYDDE